MSFAAYHRQCVGHYLTTNKLTSLGQINGNILEDITQRAFESYEAQTKAKKKRSLEASPEALAVYHAYPRQVGRADALAAIKGEQDKGVELSVLLSACTRYSACVAKWPRAYRYPEGRDMVPYPATWLRAERYLDNPREWMPAGNFQRPDDPREGGSERQPGPLPEPPGWAEEYPDSVYKTWAEVPQDSRRAICDHMNKQRI